MRESPTTCIISMNINLRRQKVFINLFFKIFTLLNVIIFVLISMFDWTRPMKLHDDWLFKYQINGILSSGHWNFELGCNPSLWVWIGLNCIFGLWNTSAVDFKGEKQNAEKIIFHYLKIDAFSRITYIPIVDKCTNTAMCGVVTTVLPNYVVWKLSRNYSDRLLTLGQ